MSEASLPGWDRLRHGGLLLDPPRLQTVAALQPGPLGAYHDQELRRQAAALLAGEGEESAFVAFVLERVCGFAPGTGAWTRGSAIGAEWNRRTPTGDTIKPRHLWHGEHGALLPVFLESERQVGIGRGRRTASQVVRWLRAGRERLALLTNGRQWRLIFAGLDFDAWCEWDVDLWFEEGELSPQVQALRTLLSPQAWTPTDSDQPGPLLTAVLDSRKGQAELSAALGERVREAVELLVQGHGDVLRDQCADVNPADIYRAAVRVVMRLVVVLFAESRDLLPRDNTLYHGAYGVGGLLEELEKTAARGGSRLARSWSAWPRLLALFRLVHQGSHHPALPVPAYGGELFEPAVGRDQATDGLHRALYVFETAAFDTSRGVFPDRDVHRMLEKISRTRVKLRQGRQKTWVTVPVDFSDLSSEYIGILYEGLLDFELKTAPSGDPVIFLAVGNQPALPLSRLEEMDDRALAALLEKMKDTSSGDDEESEAGEETPDEGEGEGPGDGEEGEEDADDAAEEESVDTDDDRHVTRTRAEVWACRAVEAGKLVRRPRASANADTRRAYEGSVSRKARQLVVRVVLPGEWYLVRWGGTRKGSGTFYTRPGLAVPTVQRTLRPLLYDPPVKDDGKPDVDAPVIAWLPKRPEDILAIKTCDSACGSGTFPVAVLRYVTDALYAAVHHHGRVADRGDRSVVSLLRARTEDADDVAALGQELIPCPSEDASFEPRLRAVLKRHVVERCIYGVDLDPLAVELCRLSLWIETMDRTLPFSFLDHKVKCGNALVGTWFDQFLHYPVMAWKNREGGDKNHSNGVHFAKDARGKALREFATGKLKSDLMDFLTGQLTLAQTPRSKEAAEVHADVLALLARLHDLPVQDASERARIYRDELIAAPAYQKLKAAMDLWCACWFWPAEALDDAPLPSRFAEPSEATCTVAAGIATRLRFFHWELEFPDVFCAERAGFNAVLGNPPWDIAKPNSKEFFSNIDPLYRAYGKQEALRRQTSFFASFEIERQWLDYTGDFRAQSNFMKYAAASFGDPDATEENGGKFNIIRGRQNEGLHSRWRELRAKERGYSDPEHPFRRQGSADINLYKAFLEMAYALLRPGGRFGYIVPSGLYSDHGTGALRRLLLDQCQWEWLFSFENRDKIFEIHRSFKFNAVVAQKGGSTAFVRTAFMRRKLEDWELAESHSAPYARSDINHFSPYSKAILELVGSEDLPVLGSLSVMARPSTHASLGHRAVEFAKGDFDMVAGSKYFRSRDIAANTDALGIMSDPEGGRLLPLYEGRMIGAFNCSKKGWVRGRGRSAVWRDIDVSERLIEPQWLVSSDDYMRHGRGLSQPRVGFIRVTANTNVRTVYSTILPPFPTGFTACQLRPVDGTIAGCLELATIMNSFAFDYFARRRVCGLDIAWFHVQELPVPSQAILRSASVLNAAASLSLTHPSHSAYLVELISLGLVCKDFRLALAPAERMRLRCTLDAVAAATYGLKAEDMRVILGSCDYPKDFDPASINKEIMLAKAFWRVDISSDPELRHTILTQIAFKDLQSKVSDQAGNLEAGIKAFLSQNNGEGWLLPETVRLADYDLGHDERALEHQPVASRLGPRFYDWQLAQPAEESWRECHLHARNLLGEAGYQDLLAEIEAERTGLKPVASSPPIAENPVTDNQQLPLFS